MRGCFKSPSPPKVAYALSRDDKKVSIVAVVSDVGLKTESDNDSMRTGSGRGPWMRTFEQRE